MTRSEVPSQAGLLWWGQWGVGVRGSSVDRPAGPEGNSDTGQQGDCTREHVLAFHVTHENSIKGDA